MKFQFEEDKAIAAVLHIAQKLRERDVQVGFHKIFKILYFADREHLARWGRPITGDKFYALEDGPVPTVLYDIFKSLRNKHSAFDINPEDYKQYFDVRGYVVVPKQHPNLDDLSDSDLECLDQSIAENAPLSYGVLSDKSHGPAWEAAEPNGKMSFVKIAKEAGADSKMRAYIRLNKENSSAL